LTLWLGFRLSGYDRRGLLKAFLCGFGVLLSGGEPLWLGGTS
jgi:hypothetical protein